MFELLLSAVIIPLTKKLGEKWLDRLSDGIDQNVIDMIKNVANDQATSKELQRVIKKDKASQTKLASNLEDFINNDASIDLLSLSYSLNPSIELGYYKKLLDTIIKVCCNLNTSLVLKGFFNGEHLISYFHLTKFDSEREKTWLSEHNYISMYSSDFELYVVIVDDSNELDNRYKELLESIELSNYKRLDYDVYKEFSKVDNIYLKWVKYDKSERNYNDLSDELKKECRIDNNKGAELMMTCLKEYLSKKTDNQNELRALLG